MPHGERAQRLSNHCGREYGKRRDHKLMFADTPRKGHHQSLSVKDITARRERRKGRAEAHHEELAQLEAEREEERFEAELAAELAWPDEDLDDIFGFKEYPEDYFDDED